MGFFLEAYDLECAAIVHALAVAAERASDASDAESASSLTHKPRSRGTLDELGLGQTYALQARKAIAALREREPSVEIEIRWCPAHKGIPGNEIADGWDKQAASEPDNHGVEWPTLANGARIPSRATSIVQLRRRASEKKWPEARSWCEQRWLNKGYVLREEGKPDPRPQPGRRSERPRSLPAQVRACPRGRVLEEHG